MESFSCRHFEALTCQSCSYLDQTAEEAISGKQWQLQSFFPDVVLQPAVACETPFGSRIRARLAVTGTFDNPVFGFFNDLQQVVPVADCPLHHPLITSAIGTVREFMRSAKLTPYSPELNTGELKFLVLTASPSHNQLMLQWVLRSREAVDRIRSVWRKLSGAERGSVGVMTVGIQSQRSSRIYGDEDILISEAPRLRIQFGPVELGLGSGSFVQTNHEIASKLYLAAQQRLSIGRPGRVLDLYCGTGAFSLLAGRCGHDVLGIDITAESIASATESAETQGIAARFTCRSLQAFQAQQLAGQEFDTVICNPPRRGLDAAAKILIQSLQPQRILYSSCNPETLRRDIEPLRGTMEIRFLQLFDMFPMNRHYEVLCELVRPEGNQLFSDPR